MTQESALAKPSLARSIFRLMIGAGSLAPGYREPDGTTYRILNFHSDAEVPANLSKKFRGAIAEWANDSEAATGLTLYTNEEEFRADFARIDIVSDRI